MNAVAYSKSGVKAAAAVKLDKNIFGQEAANHQLLKQAYLAHAANGRDNIAQAKRRGQVRGGGAKPWRQKGTGRARVGSSRNPVWTGGGVAFGPNGNENYSLALNKRSRRTALKQALSVAATENRVKVIDDLVFADGKTKSVAKLLNKVGASGKILLIADTADNLVRRACANLPDVTLISFKLLNTYNVLNADCLVITKPALSGLSQHFTEAKHV